MPEMTGSFYHERGDPYTEVVVSISGELYSAISVALDEDDSVDTGRVDSYDYQFRSNDATSEWIRRRLREELLDD